tara:strand:+ start:2688 stop:4307 length:1620 start_codon:yes stop_codon:yes gene_type:complete
MHQQKLVALHICSLFFVFVAEKSVAGPVRQNYKEGASVQEESIEADTTKEYQSSVVSVQTGKKLAVFEFEGKDISAPLITKMTEEFRNTVRDLRIFEVQDRSLTQRVNILLPETTDYWDCWDIDCALERGRLLDVNYVIAGTIQEFEDFDSGAEGKISYLIQGRLYSIDMETLSSNFSMSSTGITDSLLLGMKKLAYDVSGLPIPDSLGVTNDTTNVIDLSLEKRRLRILDLRIPEKIKSLALSTVVPGTGQIYSKRKYVGMGILATEIFLAGFAFIWHSDYQQSWGGFENTYERYQRLSDPRQIQELRPKVIKYANDTRRYNNLMKGIRNLGISVWVVNMVHAYIVGPEEVYDGGKFFGGSPWDSKNIYGKSSSVLVQDFISGFGLQGSIQRPLSKSEALAEFRNHTSGGLKLRTPFEIKLRSLQVSLQYEITNYTFDKQNYDKENAISGLSRALVFNIDISRLNKIGGKKLEKNILVGRSTATHGKGILTGFEILYNIDSNLPISVGFFGRTNIINSVDYDVLSWITLGANLGIDIP